MPEMKVNRLVPNIRVVKYLILNSFIILCCRSVIPLELIYLPQQL